MNDSIITDVLGSRDDFRWKEECSVSLVNSTRDGVSDQAKSLVRISRSSLLDEAVYDSSIPWSGRDVLADKAEMKLLDDVQYLVVPSFLFDRWSLIVDRWSKSVSYRVSFPPYYLLCTFTRDPMNICCITIRTVFPYSLFAKRLSLDNQLFGAYWRRSWCTVDHDVRVRYV